MGKQRFRRRDHEAPRYPTRREILLGVGALLGAGALAACDPFVTTQGEPVMPDDAGVYDAGGPDAGEQLMGEPELPDAGGQ